MDCAAGVRIVDPARVDAGEAADRPASSGDVAAGGGFFDPTIYPGEVLSVCPHQTAYLTVAGDGTAGSGIRDELLVPADQAANRLIARYRAAGMGVGYAGRGRGVGLTLTDQSADHVLSGHITGGVGVAD